MVGLDAVFIVSAPTPIARVGLHQQSSFQSRLDSLVSVLLRGVLLACFQASLANLLRVRLLVRVDISLEFLFVSCVPGFVVAREALAAPALQAVFVLLHFVVLA